VIIGDAVSLVSEVLDAEVTALTNSSSPGSSSGSSGHASARKRWRGDDHPGNISGEIPGNRTDETLLTSEETSSSGIASKNTSSQNRTGTSSSSGGAMQQSPPGTSTGQFN